MDKELLCSPMGWNERGKSGKIEVFIRKVRECREGKGVEVFFSFSFFLLLFRSVLDDE